MPSEARLENFFEKFLKKGPKIHYFALKFTVGPPNCITGASKSWGQGGDPGLQGPPLDPLVYFPNAIRSVIGLNSTCLKYSLAISKYLILDR